MASSDKQTVSKKEQWIKSLEKRRSMTFDVNASLFQEKPPFPREITLDINNRCNHKCYFCANPKIEHYTSLDTDLAYDIMGQAIKNGCTDNFVCLSDPSQTGI